MGRVGRGTGTFGGRGRDRDTGHAVVAHAWMEGLSLTRYLIQVEFWDVGSAGATAKQQAPRHETRGERRHGGRRGLELRRNGRGAESSAFEAA